MEPTATPTRPEGERMIVNMGPSHPVTHGTLHIVLELEGEIIVKATPNIGYLHRGVEKLGENLTYQQFIPLTDRLNYCSSLMNNVGYTLAVEKLLGIQDPPRSQVLRVLCSELARIGDHLVCIGINAVDIGAFSAFLYLFRERETIYDLFEMMAGQRLHSSFTRIGGLFRDIPAEFEPLCGQFLDSCPRTIDEMERLLTRNPIWADRTKGVGAISAEDAISWGYTGPCLRAAGVAQDLRKAQPYLGYDGYDFDIPVATTGDIYDRYLVRTEEMRQSLRIVRQCLDRLEPGPVMIEDKKLAWPADLKLGPDGLGNSPEHIAKIMGKSMEGLIHHFKLVTEGIRVPPGQVYVAVESPRGELGVHMVSDGGTRPYRVHYRDPSFTNLQAVAAMCEGGMVADAISAVASIDPVMGGVDR